MPPPAGLCPPSPPGSPGRAGCSRGPWHKEQSGRAPRVWGSCPLPRGSLPCLVPFQCHPVPANGTSCPLPLGQLSSLYFKIIHEATPSTPVVDFCYILDAVSRRCNYGVAPSVPAGCSPRGAPCAPCTRRPPRCPFALSVPPWGCPGPLEVPQCGCGGCWAPGTSCPAACRASAQPVHVWPGETHTPVSGVQEPYSQVGLHRASVEMATASPFAGAY